MKRLATFLALALLFASPQIGYAQSFGHIGVQVGVTGSSLLKRLLKNSTYLRRRLLPDLRVAKYSTNHRFACDFAPRSRPRFARLAYGVVFQQPLSKEDSF